MVSLKKIQDCIYENDKGIVIIDVKCLREKGIKGIEIEIKEL